MSRDKSIAPQGLSDDEFRVLEAYVDEELSMREVDKLERRLATSPALSGALDEIESMRKVFQHCFSEEVKARSEHFDCWSAVQARILSEEKDGVFQRWSALVREFLAAPGPSNGAFAALSTCAIAALAFAFSVRNSTPSIEADRTQPNIQVASLADSNFLNSNTDLNAALKEGNAFGVNYEGDAAPSVPVRNVSLSDVSSGGGSNGLSQGFNPSFSLGQGGSQAEAGIPARAFGEGLSLSNRGVTIPLPSARQLAALRELASAPGNSPVGMSVQLMITPKGRALRVGGSSPNFAALENRMNYLRSGISTPSADIDWARSDNALKIVPSKRDGAVPVIWVSGRRSSVAQPVQ